MKTAEPALNTDRLILDVFNLASNDLAPLTGVGSPRVVTLENLSEYREGFPEYIPQKWSDPMVFKAKYQLNTMLKRYITKPECVNQGTLVKKAFTAFLDTQVRISAPREELSTRSFLVCREARRIIRGILGPYSMEEHMNKGRFGKRAAVGVSYRKSYLDVRVQHLTGSTHHLNWFRKDVISKDDILRRVCKRSSYNETDHLSLTTVPKTWNKLRTILKNTVVGGFYTAGLGDLIVQKLKDYNYSLSRRQELHRHVVASYSRDLSHVTADLSSASDSFSWSLMNRLFPRDWYNALKFGAIRKVRVGSRMVQLQSFMTMGLGFTFPCQTLAFYAILKAIQSLLGKRYGTVSVFGDDLIYPSYMHRFVVSTLVELGFLLNEEKTFVTTPFRESCGADYYDGVDVRPFQPEGACEELSGLRAAAYLYKVYNGLTLRWGEDVLKSTLAYLRARILCFTKGGIHQVPCDYPAYSGIHTGVVKTEDTFLQPTLDENGSGLVQCLSFKSRLREVPVELYLQLCYFWDSLRSLSKNVEVDEFNQLFDDSTDSTVLIWRRVKRKRSTKKGPPVWKDLWLPHVSRKGANLRVSEEVKVDHRFVIDGSKLGK